MKQIKVLIGAIIALIVLSPVNGSLAQNANPTVRGTVTDEDLKPVNRAQVQLISQDGATHCQGVTGIDGRFVLMHKPSDSCCLEVCPPKGSSLASAWIEPISGEESRRIVVELKHGFEIHGRVVHAGGGLKGLTVAISPIDKDSKTEKLVHGQGRSLTNKNGQFEMILTPGMKCLTISNERYPELVSSLSCKLVVKDDGIIPDIELPNRQQDRGENRP